MTYTIIEPLNVYGIKLSPDEIKERAGWHKTTLIECEVPKKVYKKISKLIDKELKAYRKKCKCGRCKLDSK